MPEAEEVAWKRFNRADRPPTKNHDNRKGYGPGSFWFNYETGELFVCIDNVANAAEWFSFGLERFAKVAETGDYQDLKNRPRLGDSAGKNVGTATGQVASARDDRIVNALQRNKNLSDLEDVRAALEALGIGRGLQKIMDAASPDAIVDKLGLTGAATLRQTDERYQPKSKTLTKLAEIEIGAFAAESVLTWKRFDEAQVALQLKPGHDVAKNGPAVDRINRLSEPVMKMLEAPNMAAVREILELKPDVAFVPARQVKKALGDIVERLERLERSSKPKPRKG